MRRFMVFLPWKSGVQPLVSTAPSNVKNLALLRWGAFAMAQSG